MITICPQPPHWAAICQRLIELARIADQSIPPSPKPLILAGWAYSNDLEKQARWRETVEWAEKWGFTEIIKAITPEMMYQFENPSTNQIGPLGGPMHLD